MELGSCPANKVFSNADLRERILGHAIMNGEDVSREDVRSIRMVNTEWAVTISEIFQEKKEPLFHLVLDKENSLNGTTFVKENGKLLDSFVTGVIRPNSRIHEIVPPFSLDIKEEFFREENRGSLSRCFKMCGEGLVEMELNLPLKPVSFQGILRIPPLPLMKKLTVSFPNQKMGTTSNNFCYLLDKILEKATEMTAFEVKYSPKVPTDFHTIFLPPSLTSIKLACVLQTHQLTIINDNELPNLSHLELLVPQQSLGTEHLFEALDSVRTTLKTISILGMAYTGTLGKVTYLRFPLMENLDKLEVASINCELAAGASELQQVLPKLMELTLTNLTLPKFKNWIASLASTTVTTVDVHVVAVSPPRKDFSTFTLDRLGMSDLDRCFPNLGSLSISVNLSPVVTSGILYIFQKMIQLTHLTLEVVPGSGLGADFWDCLLIGAKQCTVDMLRSHPESWEELQLTPGITPSIRNLINLRSLSLWEAESDELQSANPEPLITDVSIHFAFLKMANLKTLNFRGGFKVSARIMNKWEKVDGDHEIICE